MNATIDNILDVTQLEPRMKHPTIFSRFDDLNEGESLTIHNDHDPKPLYYQLLGERGDVFTWEYLAEGPEWWKVKIAKRMKGEKEETLGQIASKDLRKAEVFKKYGIDFCCGGKKTVKQACADKGLDVALIEKELQQIDKVLDSRPLPYNEWALDFLVDYIVNTHHTYVKKYLPELKVYAAKVAKVHGQQHPELIPIRQLVEEISMEFVPHMSKEEQVLFPYIKEMVASKTKGSSLQGAPFGSIHAPIHMMEADHESAGKHMEEIRRLSANFTLPQDACASYSLLYRMLAEFEGDLHTHVHLENNILFPKAVALEKELSSSVK